VQFPVAALLVVGVVALLLAALVLVYLPVAVVQPGKYVGRRLYRTVFSPRLLVTTKIRVHVIKIISQCFPVLEEALGGRPVALAQPHLVLVVPCDVTMALLQHLREVGGVVAVELVRVPVRRPARDVIAVAAVVHVATSVRLVQGEPVTAHAAEAPVVVVEVHLDPWLETPHQVLKVVN